MRCPTGNLPGPGAAGAAGAAAIASAPHRLFRLQYRGSPYLFVAPFLVLFLTFGLYPLAKSLVLSFYLTSGPDSQVFVGLENFRFLAGDPDFGKAVWNTFLFALGSVFLQLPLSLGLALLLNRRDLVGRNVFRLCFFSPHLVGMVFVGVLFSLIFASRFGLLNVALNYLIGAPLDTEWLTRSRWIMPCLVGTALWMYVGFNMIYFLAALQNVDETLYEAATVDGANAWQRFWHVTLPGIKPVAVFVVILSTIGSFQLFELPYLMLGNSRGAEGAGLTIVMYLFENGFVTGDLGYASAIGWTLAVGVLCLAMLQMHLSGTWRREDAEPGRLRLWLRRRVAGPLRRGVLAPLGLWVVRPLRALVSPMLRDICQALGRRPVGPAGPAGAGWMPPVRPPARRGHAAARVLGLCATHLLLILAGALTLVPLVWLVACSIKAPADFFQYTFFPPVEKFSLANFRGLFEQIPFLRLMMNSLFVTCTTVMVQLFFSALGGFALAKYEFRGKRAVMVLMLATMMIPSQVMLAPMYELICRMKLADSYLGLIVPGAVSVFGMFLFRQSMMQIPDELLQAGRIDGCSEFGLFWRIAVPISRPMIGAFCLIAFMGTWNSFLWPQIILQSRWRFTLPIALNQLIGLQHQDYGVLMAGTLLSILPVAVLFFILQKEFLAGLTAGAVKG